MVVGFSGVGYSRLQDRAAVSERFLFGESNIDVNGITVLLCMGSCQKTELLCRPTRTVDGWIGSATSTVTERWRGRVKA